MFQSQIVIDYSKQSLDIYAIHQVVMSGFCAELKPTNVVLYRIVARANRIVTITVQSKFRPVWKGTGILSAKTVEFTPKFYAGEMYCFSICANPIVTRNRKRIGLIDDDLIKDWLRRKEEQLGVTFSMIFVTKKGFFRGVKHGDVARPIIITTAMIEGFLKVQQKEHFYDACVNGIGHAKSFGCGLLSLSKA